MWVTGRPHTSSDDHFITFQLRYFIFKDFLEWQPGYGLTGTHCSFGELCGYNNPDMVPYRPLFRHAFPSQQLKGMLSVARTKGH